MDTTPPEYTSYCQNQCLVRAMALCDLWTNVSAMNHLDLLDDMLLIGACIYQTAKILHHLHHLPLISQYPERSGVLRRQLEGALKMAQQSRLRRSPRMKECLREAELLIQTLGQSRAASPLSTPNADMTSRGTFAPRDWSDSDEITEAPTNDEQSGQGRGPTAYPPLESAEQANIYPNYGTESHSSQPPRFFLWCLAAGL